MNARVNYLIHCIIGITALAMLGYAFSQPLATLSMSENNIQAKVDMQATIDIYITKECSSVSVNGKTESQCSAVSPLFSSQQQALMGIVIALMICIFLEFIGMKFNNVVSNVFGVLVLCLSIALIVSIAMLSQNTMLFKTFQITSTSIGVLVVAILLVLYELCCNNLVHRAVLVPYRMISSAGKKA